MKQQKRRYIESQYPVFFKRLLEKEIDSPQSAIISANPYVRTPELREIFGKEYSIQDQTGRDASRRIETFNFLDRELSSLTTGVLRPYSIVTRRRNMFSEKVEDSRDAEGYDHRSLHPPTLLEDYSGPDIIDKIKNETATLLRFA